MRMDEFTEKETALALRWLRAKQWLDSELENEPTEKPTGFVDYYDGIVDGRRHALLSLKARFFLSDEEAAESWKMRKEMGF